MEPPDERNGHSVVNKAVSPATNGYQNGNSHQQDKEELDDIEDMGKCPCVNGESMLRSVFFFLKFVVP
jgi:hypothetical protein